MSNNVDIKYKSIPFSGVQEDKELDYYQSFGIVSENIQDAEKEFLTLAGFTNGSISDRWKSFLTRLGYTGSVDDMLPQYWKTVESMGAPSLGLNFTTTTTLDPRITFTRASNATQFNSTGTLVYAPHNLLTFSEQFNDTAWTGSTLNVTVSSNTTVSPDGTTTTDTLDFTNASSYRYQLYNPAVSLEGVTFVFSVWLASATKSKIALRIAGTVTGTGGQTLITLTPTLTRYNVTVTIPAGNTAVFVGFENRDFLGGDGLTGTIRVWGAQLNVNTLQPYYPTTSAVYQGPRFDYDPVTQAAQGLLIEESRTNSLTYSEQFDNVASWAATGAGGTVTANQAVAPDGNTTADQLTFTANSVSGVRQNVTLTAVSYTLSCWMRSISGAATARLKYFNGTTDTFSSDFALTTTWQRFSFTFTGVAVAGNISINNSTAGTIQNIYIWGAQLEAGAFPTSYIPTITTALTRSADVVSVNTLSPWFNATEGTIYVDFAGRQAGAQPYLTMLSNTGETERIYQRYVSGQYQTIARVAGVDIASVYNSSEGSAVNAKIASAYNSSQLATSTNGQAVTGFAVALLSSVPSGLNKLWLGSFTGTSAFANGYLRRITYYPRRLSDAELQAITA